MISFNAWGVTAFDSIDTMVFMGLNEEYGRALEIVRGANFTETPVSYLIFIFVYVLTLCSIILYRSLKLLSDI